MIPNSVQREMKRRDHDEMLTIASDLLNFIFHHEPHASKELKKQAVKLRDAINKYKGTK